jgi:hypothetical protein
MEDKLGHPTTGRFRIFAIPRVYRVHIPTLRVGLNIEVSEPSVEDCLRIANGPLSALIRRCPMEVSLRFSLTGWNKFVHPEHPLRFRLPVGSFAGKWGISTDHPPSIAHTTFCDSWVPPMIDTKLGKELTEMGISDYRLAGDWYQPNSFHFGIAFYLCMRASADENFLLAKMKYEGLADAW